ncbi:YjzD family protein [Vagococcus vulneris]|uniref:DUF2929 domain-containing protein n=1 Tax=Vagococcus vulneris TaxID=1977869 RepID=A0A429ZZ29_9ENTE|nr:YjzD family protein [Vagococcus vulneris]RST99265.1 DUF2929 domain-containing protein [Vagococcus vulneris]
MGKIVVLIWTFLLGQVVGYIGGALNQGSYNFMATTIVSLIAGILVMILAKVAQPAKVNK